MSQSEQTQNWVLYRLLPNFQRVPIATFYSRHDAEATLRVMQQLLRDARFVIAFEINVDAGESEASESAESGADMSSSPQQSTRTALKIFVIGSRSLVTRTLRSLHSLGFADRTHWSPMIPAREQDEVMSVLVRYFPRD